MLESWLKSALTDGALARVLKVDVASPVPPTTGGVTGTLAGLACTGGVAFVTGAGVNPGVAAPVGKEPGAEGFWLELAGGRLPVLKKV